MNKSCKAHSMLNAGTAGASSQEATNLKVKIFKRNLHWSGNWLPYLIIECSNVTPEEYAKMHSESEYSQYRYQIL